LPDAFSATEVFTDAFGEPVAYGFVTSEQQQALFLHSVIQTEFYFCHV